MWVFIFVGIIPFVIVFGIIIYKVINAGKAYNKTKEAIFDIVTTQVNNTIEKNENCDYCGKQYDGNICPHCGAESTRK